MPAKQSYFLATGLWFLMVVAFFWPVIFQGKVIAPLDILDSLLRPWAATDQIKVHNAFTYDAISQYLPYDWSVFQSLRHDGYIGWNPYTHSGTSIIENTMTCPGDWHHHLYRVLPFWVAWNTGIVLQFTLAGIGMLLLLRDQSVPATYALMGVVAFGFYSQFVLWINHRWILGAMCWAPWILWALFRAKKSGSVIHLPSIAFIALAFRGGHLQTCVFVVLLVIIVAASDWWQSSRRWNFRYLFRTFLPYAVCGIIGAVFALDVIIETVPALLHGKRDMPARSWGDTLLALPTLATSAFPTLMGSPQGLDVMKPFRTDLFSIKFMSALALCLAVAAFFRRQAPAPAKALVLVGLLVPFTPLDQWLYSRFTVVFALGGAWLAAWHLNTISTEPRSEVWRRSLILLGVVAGVWLLGSAVVAANHAWCREKLHEAVLAKLPAGKASRADWMLSRADVFLMDSLVWAPRNLAMLGLIALGLFALSRIHQESRGAPRFALLAAVCAFGEILLFASTWITFSEKPDGAALYTEPPWSTQLRSEAGSGTILCLDRSDFDYMQLNTPSTYGIRFAEGYETVTPRRIDPSVGKPYDPERCAASGISHLLVSPEQDPGEISGWVRCIDSQAFVLYSNPAFQGPCYVEFADGTKLPQSLQFTTPNRREIHLPKDTKSMILAESFNPGWRYRLPGQGWKPVHATNLNGIRIDLEDPTQAESTLLQLQYRPAQQRFYRPVMGMAVLGLLIFSIRRRSRRRLG